MKYKILIAFLSLITLCDIQAQVPVEVKIINSSGPAFNGTEPEGVDLNGIYLFVADDGVHGKELWRSDGTEAGTYMLKDIYPGSESSLTNRLKVVGDKVCFIANDSLHGREPWVTDGTENGTHLLMDLRSGTKDGIPVPSLISSTFDVLNGAFYFLGFPETGIPQLWRTDGTIGGTKMVSEICNQPCDSIGPFRQTFAALGNLIFFNGPDRVWQSDGTANGTYPSPLSGSQIYRLYGKVGNKIILSNTISGTISYQLSLSDGTPAGTELFWQSNRYVGYFVALKDKVFFISGEGPNLMVSSGSLSSTKPAAPGLIIGDQFNPYTNLYVWKDHVYFAAASSPNSDQYIYKHNGDTATRVAYYISNDNVGFQNFVFFESDDQFLYFDPLDETDQNNAGLGRIDENDSDTLLYKSEGIINIKRAADKLFFAGYEEDNGYQLWMLSLPHVGSVDISWLPESVKFFPTASLTGHYQLTAPDVESCLDIEVFDQLGRVVSNNKSLCDGNILILENLPDGMYWAKLYDVQNHAIRYQKLIKY